jgi:hypothetical protein
VFTGGRFFLTSADVDVILADNGYQRVEHPCVGDLIVYDGGSHTGVVRGVQDGFVVVESKWGMQSCYLHRPEAYGRRFEYFRSRRSGHVLHGLPGQAGVGELVDCQTTRTVPATL